MYFLSASGVALGVSLWVNLEVSLLVDVGTSPGVTVPPAGVGVDVSTWVVGVFPSTVQVYMQFVQLVCQSVQAQQTTALGTSRTCVDQFHCRLSTDVGSTDCPHLHSVELA